MEEWEVFPRVAAAVATKAAEQGLARNPLSYQEELERARTIIKTTLEKLHTLYQAGFIPPLPPEIEAAARNAAKTR